MYSESLSYNPDLHIDPGTKKPILGLLNSLLSVVPVGQKPEADPTGQDSVPDEGKDGYIEEALLNAREHAELLKGIIDPGELERYYRYLKDYREISLHMTQLLEAVNSYRDTAYEFSIKLAELLEEHLEMISPGFKSALRVKPGHLDDQPRLRVV